MRAYKYGGTVNENLLVLNSSDITFSDFFKGIDKEQLPPEITEVVEKINRLAYRNDVVKNLNMSDDRVLFVANKVMVNNVTALSSFGLNEWFISYQFLNRFYDRSWVDLDKVIRFMNLYIGYRFTDNVISEEERKELSDMAKSLDRAGISTSYADILSPNILAEITGKSVDEVILETIEPVVDEAQPVITDESDEIEEILKKIALAETKIGGFVAGNNWEKDEVKKAQNVNKIKGFEIGLNMLKKKLEALRKKSPEKPVEVVEKPVVNQDIEDADIVVPTESTADPKESNAITFVFEGDEITMKKTDFVDFIDNNSYLQRMDEEEETGELVQINTFEDAKEYAIQKMNLTIIGETFAEGGFIGFKGLQEKVAKHYKGKPVPKKWQSQYGKTYSEKDAKMIGAKVAGKVYTAQNNK